MGRVPAPRTLWATNLPRVEPVYRSVVGVARVLFFLQGLRITVTGETNIPTRGGAVLAVNHTGYLDFTFAGLPSRTFGRYVRFMAKKEVFDNPWTGWLMRKMKHIPVDRSHGGESYQEAVSRLRSGQLVGVYPEATISPSFELGEFKSGAARMAIEAEVPIVPVIVWGAQRIWTKGHPKHLGRTKTPIAIAVGEPIDYRQSPGELTATVRQAMQRLLEEVQRDYHHEPGAYWVPARLGGSAPAPDLDDREAG